MLQWRWASCGMVPSLPGEPCGRVGAILAAASSFPWPAKGDSRLEDRQRLVPGGKTWLVLTTAPYRAVQGVHGEGAGYWPRLGAVL